MPSSARPTITCSPLRFSRRRPSTAVRTYEVIGKVASNTMAATVISAVLVGGCGPIQNVFKTTRCCGNRARRDGRRTAEIIAALQPDMTAGNEPPVQREGGASAIGAVAASAVSPAAKEADAAAISHSRTCPGVLSTYNLAVSGIPALRRDGCDRGIVLYRGGDLDRRTSRSVHSSLPRTHGGPRSPPPLLFLAAGSPAYQQVLFTARRTNLDDDTALTVDDNSGSGGGDDRRRRQLQRPRTRPRRRRRLISPWVSESGRG